MATYSSNTTLKVSAAISVARGTTGSFFTVAANSYAIVQIYCYSYTSGTATVQVDGQTIATFTAAGNATITGIYVGPSIAVAFNNTGTSSVMVQGVQFINTP